MFNVSQDLLDMEKTEMVSNAAMERGTKSFNFGAYHTLDEVSINAVYYDVQKQNPWQDKYNF